MIAPRAYGRVTHLPKTYCPNFLLSDHPVDDLPWLVRPPTKLSVTSAGAVASSVRRAPSKGCVLADNGWRTQLRPLPGGPEDRYEGWALITQEPAFQGGQAEAALKDSGLHCVLAAYW